jgi:hypothetical protein
MKAQDPQSTKDITCPFDTDEPRAVYTISTALPVGVRNKFMDVFMDVARKVRGDEQVKTSELYSHYRELVKVGLKAVQNVYDGKGNTVVLNGSVSDAVLDTLAEVRLIGSGFDNLVNWLGTEIWNANTLQEEEKKS